MKFKKKFFYIDIPIFLILILILLISFFLTLSASRQNFSIIKRKIFHIFLGIILMIFFSQISPKIYEEFAPYFYYLSLILLIFVSLFGTVHHGAKRWLNIWFLVIQPSEISKISVPLMIARFFNRNSYQIKLRSFIFILILIFFHFLLILNQPDLGTSILILLYGLISIFLSEISWKVIFIFFIFLVLFLPIFWIFIMHDYQKNRIFIFLNPKSDQFGSGYHIIQSKIAIGSGGLFGKGWLKGTQSQLNFIPEQHTDFIFSVFSEEFGFFGVLILISMYLFLIFRGLLISLYIKNIFGKIFIGSFSIVLFFCIFINIGMVSGILPVVGIPFPIISYGGSALVIFMIQFGIVTSIYKHKRIFSNNI